MFVEPAGGWASETQAAKLTASDGAAGDGSAARWRSPATTVVAGAPGATVNGNAGQGAAYVFVEPSGGWASETQAAKLTASDGAAGDDLGWAVAVSGDTVVAGAPYASPGAVYVFIEPAGGWASETQAAKLTASDGAASDALGGSVAVSGDTVVAGAPGATVNGNAGQGAAYVFGPAASADPTTTSVSCLPGTVAVGQSTTCTATVTDTAASPSTPTGTVSFSSDTSRGAFSSSGSCTLSPTGTAGQASCSVSYTPGQIGIGTQTITASYGGDSGHAASSAASSAATLVVVPAPPPPPTGSVSSASGSSSTPGGTASASNAGTRVSAVGVGSLTVSQYGSNPVGQPAFSSAGEFFDVEVASGSSFSSLTISDCNLNGGTSLQWWNGSAWVAVSPQSYAPGSPACVTATLGTGSSPTIAQLTGTVFAVAKPGGGVGVASIAGVKVGGNDGERVGDLRWQQRRELHGHADVDGNRDDQGRQGHRDHRQEAQDEEEGRGGGQRDRDDDRRPEQDRDDLAQRGRQTAAGKASSAQDQAHAHPIREEHHLPQGDHLQDQTQDQAAQALTHGTERGDSVRPGICTK